MTKLSGVNYTGKGSSGFDPAEERAELAGRKPYRSPDDRRGSPPKPAKRKVRK